MGYPCHNEAILEFFQIQVGHVQPPLDIRPVLFQPLTTLNSRSPPPRPRISIFGFGRVSLCPFPTFVSEFTRCLVLRGWPSERLPKLRADRKFKPDPGAQTRMWSGSSLLVVVPSHSSSFHPQSSLTSSSSSPSSQRLLTRLVCPNFRQPLGAAPNSSMEPSTTPPRTTPIKRLLPPRRARLPDPAQCRLAVPVVLLAYLPGGLLPSSVLPPARQVSWELFPVATSTQTPLRGREGRKAQSGSSPVGRLEWGRCPRLRPRRGRAGRGAAWRK